MIRRRAALFAILALPWAGGPAAAQPAAPDLAVQRAAMARLAFLHGRWVGESRATRPDGSVVVSRAEDDIAPGLDGTILTIAGRSFAPGAAEGAAPAMENLGVLSFDDARGRYDVVAWAAGVSQAGHGEILADGTVRWFLESPGRRIRFDVRPQGPDGWVEIVDMSTDGGAWTRLMEIRFKRAPASRLRLTDKP